jgi:hypothetical protein
MEKSSAIEARTIPELFPGLVGHLRPFQSTYSHIPSQSKTGKILYFSGIKLGAPYWIRTRVLALRGP